MKKSYINPEMIVLQITNKHSMLAASDLGFNEYTGDGAISADVKSEGFDAWSFDELSEDFEAWSFW